MSCNCEDSNSLLDTPAYRGGDGPQGAPGFNGWFPVFASEVRDSDGAQVRKIIDYAGGTGPKPTLYIGFYESASGPVEDVELATKYDGDDGAAGAAGLNGYLAIAGWEKTGNVFFSKIIALQEVTGTPGLLGKYLLPNGTPTDTKAAALQFSAPEASEVTITTSALLAAMPSGVIWPTTSAILSSFPFETGLGSGDWAGWALADGRNGTSDMRKRVIGGLDYNTPAEAAQETPRVVDADFDTAGKLSGEKTHEVQPGEIPQKPHTHPTTGSGLFGGRRIISASKVSGPGESERFATSILASNPVAHWQVQATPNGNTGSNSSGAASTELSLQQLTIAFPFIQKL